MSVMTALISILITSVADPGPYSTDPDPDPADEKKRIRILVKYDYIAHI